MELQSQSGDMDIKRYLTLISKNKRLFIVSSLLVATLVTIGVYTVPNRYEASSTVFIEKSVIAELVKGIAVTPSVEEKIKVLTYAMNSRTLIAKVVDELDLRKSDKIQLDTLIKRLQDNTTIKVKDREGLFVISFQDRNPVIARDYTNALVRRYIDENTSSKREDSYGATQFLSDQMKVFKDKLQKSEAEVNAYKREEGSIASMDTGLLLKQINDSQQRLDDLRIRQSQLETTIAGLSKVNTVESNLPTLQKRLQELQLHYTDSYPEIIRLKDEIHSVEQQTRANPGGSKPADSPEYGKLMSELRALRQADANLSKNIARSRSQLQTIPAAKAKLDELEREKNSQKNIYEMMIARQTQSEVSKQMEVQDKSTVFRVVDPAVLPISPIKPNRIKLILLGLLFSIGSSFGLILLKDINDNSVKSLEVLKLAGLPVLAVIPRMEPPDVKLATARQDRRLYLAASVYALIISIPLFLEIAHISILSKLAEQITGRFF